MLDICPRFYCTDVSSVCIVIYWGSLWEEITSSLKNSLTITSWVFEPLICLRGRLGLDSNPSFTISWLCFSLAGRRGVICASHWPDVPGWSVLLLARRCRVILSYLVCKTEVTFTSASLQLSWGSNKIMPENQQVQMLILNKYYLNFLVLKNFPHDTKAGMGIKNTKHALKTPTHIHKLRNY